MKLKSVANDSMFTGDVMKALVASFTPPLVNSRKKARRVKRHLHGFIAPTEDLLGCSQGACAAGEADVSSCAANRSRDVDREGMGPRRFRHQVGKSQGESGSAIGDMGVDLVAAGQVDAAAGQVSPSERRG